MRIAGTSLLAYLRITDVQWGRINVIGLPMMDITLAEYERYTVKKGDLLVCEGGERWPMCNLERSIGSLRVVSRLLLPTASCQTGPRLAAISCTHSLRARRSDK